MDARGRRARGGGLRREEERSRDSAHFRERGRIRCYVRRSSALISLSLSRSPPFDLDIDCPSGYTTRYSVARTARAFEREQSVRSADNWAFRALASIGSLARGKELSYFEPVSASISNRERHARSLVVIDSLLARFPNLRVLSLKLRDNRRDNEGHHDDDENWSLLFSGAYATLEAILDGAIVRENVRTQEDDMPNEYRIDSARRISVSSALYICVAGRVGANDT